MFEAKIMHEMMGNCLVFVSDQNFGENYEMKMLEYNRIPSFLPVELSKMNNHITYQYQIMEYQTLEQRFEGAQIELEDLKQILLAMLSVQQQAAEFLLNMDSVILAPEYIFTSGKEYYFCYYPGNDMTFAHGVRIVMEYVLKYLNHRNQKDVLTAYGIYQKVLKSNFTIEMLLEDFCGEDSEPEERRKSEERREPEGRREPEATIVFQQEEVREEKKPLILSDLEQELEIKRPVTTKKAAKIKKKKSLISLFGGRKKQTYLTHSDSPATVLLAETTNYGGTHGKENGTQKKLIGQKENDSIVIQSFPAQFGNTLGKAHYQIDNHMISRDHAVITYECGIYYLEDQGSTNGTFLNGSRLFPYEPAQLKEGDIVEFANERYSFQ